MNIQSEKDLIKKQVDLVSDEKLLTAIKNLLTSAQKKQQLMAFTDDELFDRIQESRKAIETGKLIAQEEARKYFLDKDGRN